MPKLLKQAELRDILEKRDLVKAIERDLKREKEELDKLELIALYALDQRSNVERGPLTPMVETVAGRRVPRWKEVYAAYAGPEAVEQVIAETPRTPDTKKLVIVSERKIVKAS